MKQRIAAVLAGVLLGATAATIAGKGEVTVFKSGNVEKWAQTFSVEVRETLVDNWNWTGDNAAKISALEQRVAQLESHIHGQSSTPQNPASQISSDGQDSSGVEPEPTAESTTCENPGSTFYLGWFGPIGERTENGVIEYEYTRDKWHCDENGNSVYEGTEVEWRRQ